METNADIWGAFLRTGSVLIFVIVLLILFLYLMKRFSLVNFVKDDQEMIKIHAVHHFSPKEKLVLVDVMNERLLLGVTSQTIQTLAVIDSRGEREETNHSSSNDADQSNPALLQNSETDASETKEQPTLPGNFHLIFKQVFGRGKSCQ